MPQGKGYIRWIKDTPPPEGGVTIFGAKYKFAPNPALGGERIELLTNCTPKEATERLFGYFEEIDIFDPTFFEEIFWKRCAKDADKVIEFCFAVQNESSEQSLDVEEGVIPPPPVKVEDAEDEVNEIAKLL
jgi:hypothetical protein